MIEATKEQLEQLILVDNLPYTVIARQFEVSDVTIRKWAKKFGIELPNRKIKIETKLCPNCQIEFKPNKNGRGEYTNCCSNTCASSLRSKEHYKNYLEDNSVAYEQRNMADMWNDKSLVFILDHIDGNADNNERSNLRLVCPNCDSQLATFKSKNKDSARAKYRKT